MKTNLFAIILLFCGCSNPTNHPSASQPDNPDVAKTPMDEKQKPYADTDTVVIASEHFDMLKYPKEQFNEIVEQFPVLYDSLPDHPDIAYQKSGISKDYVDAKGTKKHLSFGSEVGQDEFYILYAYFLQKNNTGQELAQRRERLIAIYQCINSLFGTLSYGGTYFTHQYSRINGYAEYSVYEYKAMSDYYKKDYSIQAQKELYLAFLSQKIADEVSTDNELPSAKSKKDRQTELLKYDKTLDSLITDNFYLKKAMEFQSSYY